MLGYEDLMALRANARHEWRAEDAALYALGAGLGRDPLDESELDFVYEGRTQRVLPTFPIIFCLHQTPLHAANLDYAQLLHGEASVTLERPFPASGAATGRGRVAGAWDKGRDKGAVVIQEKELILEGEVNPIATISSTVFARGDGGFGGPAHGQPPAHQVPQRQPDKRLRIETFPGQALLYRLTGDPNPLHADPAAARALGFPRPILHGLCTFAICCRAVLAAYCDNDPAKLRHHGVRFASVVYPGETLEVSLWRDSDVVSFEAEVVERGVRVISNGKSILG
jgi:acyl dehydratase